VTEPVVVAGAEDSERYYRGTIACLNPGSRTGSVRSLKGRDFPFAARDLIVVGAARGFDALHEGLRVGFDVGRTSSGLCVTVIRVYERPR
jgi:hypothetical protein